MKMNKTKRELYDKLLCSANRIKNGEKVFGLIELDSSKDTCMTVMIDKDYNPVDSIDEMYTEIEYVEIDINTVEFVNK